MSDHGKHDEHGKHELPPDEPARPIGELRPGGIAGIERRGRSQLVFGALAVLLCVVLGVAIVTQVRQTESGDSLETGTPGRPAGAARFAAATRGGAQHRGRRPAAHAGQRCRPPAATTQAAIENARARLAALSILIGTVAATGPGVTLTIADTAPGVSPETMLDVVNELRAAGAEAMQIGSEAAQPVGSASTPGWSARAGALVVDGIDDDPAVFGSRDR